MSVSSSALFECSYRLIGFLLPKFSQRREGGIACTECRVQCRNSNTPPLWGKCERLKPRRVMRPFPWKPKVVVKDTGESMSVSSWALFECSSRLIRFLLPKFSQRERRDRVRRMQSAIPEFQCTAALGCDVDQDRIHSERFIRHFFCT